MDIRKSSFFYLDDTGFFVGCVRDHGVFTSLALSLVSRGSLICCKPECVVAIDYRVLFSFVSRDNAYLRKLFSIRIPWN